MGKGVAADPDYASRCFVAAARFGDPQAIKLLQANKEAQLAAEKDAAEKIAAAQAGDGDGGEESAAVDAADAGEDAMEAAMESAFAAETATTDPSGLQVRVSLILSF